MLVVTDKLVFIGDAAHTMSGFWGQGMNMALEDAEVLSDLLEAAETKSGPEATSVVGTALAEFTAVRGENGAAIVRMSGRHLRWYW